MLHYAPDLTYPQSQTDENQDACKLSCDFHCLHNLGPGAFQWHLGQALVPKYYTYLNSSVKLDTLKLAPIHVKIYFL